MSSLNKYLVFVNEQVGVQNRLAKKYASDQRRADMHLASRDGFIALLDALAQADVALDAVAAPKLVQTPVLTLRPDELKDLPAELIAELSEGAVPDKADLAILQALEDRGGIATLDQVLISIYHATGELSKRNTLTSKLYRMIQKGTIFAVPLKKGVYSNRRITEDEAKRLFAADQPDQQQSLV